MRGLMDGQRHRAIRAFALRCIAGALLVAMPFASFGAQLSETNSVPVSVDAPAAIAAKHPMLPEALVRFGDSTAREDRALQKALAKYEKAGDPERIAPLTDFLYDNPDSAWAPSLWLNIGMLRYRQGYFSEAFVAWRSAWDGGKSATAANQRIVADRAVGELIRMHARLGHAEEVKALLAELQGRNVLGAASEAVQGAEEALWLMQNDPGVAYLCGPSALRSVLQLTPGNQEKLEFLQSAKSGLKGVDLADVGLLAEQAGMDLVPAHRSEIDGHIPVPSVVHWRVNHYAAIVDEKDGRYQIKDPTFGDDLWLSAAAINAESSGYFLIPKRLVGSNWRPVPSEEGRQVFGMGNTSTFDQTATRPYDDKQCCGNQGGKGMPTYAMHSMLVSLNIQDTPLGYTPPKGPAVAFQLTYNQREAYQPATFTFSNVGQKWTHNWLSYVTDDPVTAGASVSLYLAGGGLESFSGYNSGTGAFATERTRGVKLIRTSGTPITYELWYPDGSVAIYSQSDGATVAPRRVFLKRILDPAGNELTLAYDGSLRLTSVTDEINQVTTLTYGDMANPLRLTRVTDPFGRYADIGYDGSGRLNQITDVIGMSSSFTYDAGTFINGMTTPYGTTTFAYGASGMTRWIEATDPLNKTERLETKHQASGISNTEAQAPSGLGITNSHLMWRNTFYWDKDAYAVDPTDYTIATLKHWLHETSSMTAPILESIKVPGEERVWFTYPGQSNSYYTGTAGVPSAVARVVDGSGTTQTTLYQYGAHNLLTKVIDPIGREHTLTYDTNGIDLLNVKRKNGGSYDTLASFTWNSAQHLPLTVTDDAGQTTTFTYNAAGQLLTATNPLSQVTTYVYDANGYLQRIDNANSVTQQSFTYDSYGRVRTSTDSEGYVLTYDYDALDRVTKVTYPDATYEQLTYNKLDVVQARDRAGKLTDYTYDAMRRLTQVDEPLPRTLTMQWSPAGRRTALYDGNNNPIQWAYDIAGRLTSETYADSSQKTYAYDVAGRLQSVTDAYGQVDTISYTLDNRIAGHVYTDVVPYAFATPSVSFTYDSVHPRLISMTDGTGTTTWAYGAIGAVGAQQVIREDGPYATNDVMAYTYDALGRRATRTIDATYSGGVLSGGQVETMTYDALGRMNYRSNVLGAFTYAYLGQTGQLASRTVAASGALNTPATLLSYDTNANDRRLTQIRHAEIPVPLTAADRTKDYNYQYDVLGRLTDVEELTYNAAGTITTKRIWDATHDDADRLESLVKVTGSSSGTPEYDYTYDDADNRGVSVINGVTQTPTHNNVNQIATLNGVGVTHKASGETTAMAGISYGWNAAGQMHSVTVANGDRYQLRYDGLGRLREMDKILSGQFLPGPLNQFRYHWCDERICEVRRRGSGPLDGQLVGGTEFDEGLQVGAESHIYLVDQLGSVRQLVRRDTTAIGKHDFGPYGETWADTGQVSQRRYAGMYYLEGPNQYVTWNRMYDANVGRWMSRDPIGVSGGVNLYGYVGGDVLGLVDRTGLIGAGVYSGGSAEGGLFYAGAAAQASSGIMGFQRLCESGGFIGSTGVYSATGGFMGKGNAEFNWLGEHNANPFAPHDGYTTIAAGLSAGLGVGAIVTNADSVEELKGPFDTWNLGVGIWNIQLAADDASGIFTFSVGVSKSIGLSFSRYKVTTDAAVTIMGNTSSCGCEK